MKKLLIPNGILVMIVIVAVVLMSGCTKGPKRQSMEEQTTETTEEQPLINPYDEVREITPVGESARNMNNAIKPILVSIFGGAKLTIESTAGFATTIMYTVKRPVVQEDTQRLIDGLKDLMEGKGYKIASTAQMEEGFMIQYLKEETGAETWIGVSKQEISITYH